MIMVIVCQELEFWLSQRVYCDFIIGFYWLNRFTNLPITLLEKQVILQSFHDYSAWPKLKTLTQLCSLFLTCNTQITTNNHYPPDPSSPQTSGSLSLINIISTVTTLGCLTLIVHNYCHLQECGCPIYASVSSVYCKWHSFGREEWLSQAPSQTQVPYSYMEGYEGQQKALTPQIHLFHQAPMFMKFPWEASIAVEAMPPESPYKNVITRKQSTCM